MSDFHHELRVRYNECDPQGIVFNAHYLMYIDVAFTEFWRARIGLYQELPEHGVDAVVAEANLTFRGPARFDDVLHIGVTTEELGTTSMIHRFDIRRDAEDLVIGRLRHVMVSTETWRKVELPDFVRAGLEA